MTNSAATTIEPGTRMADVLAGYPGARRALFRKFHLGGCSSCAIRPEETVAELCARNNIPDPRAVIAEIIESDARDREIEITPARLKELMSGPEHARPRLLDIRTREEFDAVHIPGAEFFTRDLMQEILGKWPRDTFIVICDHTGQRAHDAAAYFLGQGLTNIRCLRGGIDAYSIEADPSLPRYEIERG